jgi:hypothetical protein
MVEVKNKKTGRSYIVEKHTWDQIIALGKQDKYVLVGDIKEVVLKPMIPKDVGEIISQKRKTQTNISHD